MSTPIDVAAAMRYNQVYAPQPFLCQSTWEMVYPATPKGVEWVSAQQRSLDDPSWSKEGSNWYDPSKRISVDGMLGPQTKQALVGRYGPFDIRPQTLHPLPWFISLDRYDHAREPDTILLHRDKSWGQQDKDWESFTSQERWCDAMFRLVSGWDEKRGEFSRVPKDWISLDELSIGIAHYWADTAPKLLTAFATAFPELSAEAWGESRSLQMRDEKWIRSQVRVLKGKRAHQEKYNWLCAGWWFAARNSQAIAWQATEWLQHYGRSAKRILQYFKWTEHLTGSEGGRILAAVIRMVNSGGARRMIQAGYRLVGEKETPMRVLEAVYHAPKENGGYGKPDRWLKITQWPGFAGPAPSTFTVPLPGK